MENSSKMLPSQLKNGIVNIESMQNELQEKVHVFRMSSLDVLYSNLCHNLIPHSGKVVVFDSQLRVQHAFEGMLAHDINCAPVWDSAKRKYVGLLSVSDFIDILIAGYYASHHVQQLQIAQNVQTTQTALTASLPSSSALAPALAATNLHSNTAPQSNSPPYPGSLSLNLADITMHRICDWAAIKKDRGTSINRLLCVTPEATLHDAVRMLLQYRVHRLCVVQLALADTVLRILTNHGILRFLRDNCAHMKSSKITVRDLGIGVFKNMITVTYQTPLIKVLELLYNYKISAIPIVDENGKPVDVYSRGDVRFLAMDKMYNLDMSLGEALQKHHDGRVLPICSRDDTIFNVSGLLVSSMKHSLLCVKNDGSIEGVVSLTDIFSFILDSSPPRSESRIAALKADLEQSLHDSHLKTDLLENGVTVSHSDDVTHFESPFDDTIGALDTIDDAMEMDDTEVDDNENYDYQ